MVTVDRLGARMTPAAQGTGRSRANYGEATWTVTRHTRASGGRCGDRRQQHGEPFAILVTTLEQHGDRDPVGHGVALAKCASSMSLRVAINLGRDCARTGGV